MRFGLKHLLTVITASCVILAVMAWAARNGFIPGEVIASLFVLIVLLTPLCLLSLVIDFIGRDRSKK